MEKRTREQEDIYGYRYAKLALTWSGWGSPVGLGLGLVSVGIFLWMLHLADLIH